MRRETRCRGTFALDLGEAAATLARTSAVLALLALGCDGPSTVDAGGDAIDAGTGIDAATVDAGRAPDSGRDAGAPDAGLGEDSGGTDPDAGAVDDAGEPVLDGGPDAGPPCIPEAEPDRPDPGYTDTNCDGLDGDLARSIFVSPRGRLCASGGCPTGEIADPFRSLPEAIARARELGGFDILVANGGYDGPIVIDGDGPVPTDGSTRLRTSSIYGGYDDLSDWERGAGRAMISGMGVVLRIDGVDRVEGSVDRIELAQLEFQAGNAATGQSSIAAIAEDTRGVTLRDVAIRAGRGGNGAAAAIPPGVAGFGAMGTGGVRAVTSGPTTCGDRSGTGPNGGAFGAGCDGISGNGGRGGAGGPFRVGASDVPNEAGQPGRLANGGMGVAGGTAGTASSINGGNGNPGAIGARGSAGTGGGSFGSLVGGVYTPVAGAPGGIGGAGSGGSGGGGGFGSTGCGTSCADATCLVSGAGGGGGGGAGCGGTGSAGAGGGGASIGLILIDSRLELIGVAVTSGDGGTGGAAASGGAGQPGGGGGSGGGARLGRPCTGVCANFCGGCSGTGGDGGNGGAGGFGGSGGGGGGGPTIGISLEGSSALIGTPAITVGTGGAGGAAATMGMPGITGTVEEMRGP